MLYLLLIYGRHDVQRQRSLWFLIGYGYGCVLLETFHKNTRPGKHTKNDGKIHHAINGKIHYFDWSFSIANC